jgi:hypothetical protein
MPYLTTFYRTTRNGVAITFNLTDSKGQVIVKNQLVNLQPLAAPLTPGGVGVAVPATVAPEAATGAFSADGRRLFGASEVENCESFYLLDGRSPVEIPDTWGEARQGFRDVCESDGYSTQGCFDAEQKLFDGHPSAGEPFVPNTTLCQRLLSYTAASWHADSKSISGVVPLEPPKGAMVVPMSFSRRMKGSGYGWSSSGGYGGSYGYSAARLSRTYPAGHYPTSYGFTGVYRTNTPVLISYPMYHNHYYPYYHSYGMDDADCEGTLDRYGGCTQNITLNPETKMNSKAKTALGQTYRDNLMNTGFLGSEYVFPLVLAVAQVSGMDYQAQKICRPSLAEKDWTPPHIESLFFTLSRVDENEAPLGFFEAIGQFFRSIIFFICLPALCFYCFCGNKDGASQVTQQAFSGQQRYNHLNVQSAEFTTQERAESAPGHAGATLVVGSRVQTQYTRDEGGDDRWYAATVRTVYADGSVELQYDDGDRSRMASAVVHLSSGR